MKYDNPEHSGDALGRNVGAEILVGVWSGSDLICFVGRITYMLPWAGTCFATCCDGYAFIFAVQPTRAGDGVGDMIPSPARVDGGLVFAGDDWNWQCYT